MRRLKFTAPIEFNDPFEVWAGWSKENLTEQNVLRRVLTPADSLRRGIWDYE